MGVLDTLVGGGVFNFLTKVIDKAFPDPEQKAKAQAALIVAEQEGKLKEFELEMSVMLAEAQSDDKWTSRARPTFLYVVYILILWGLPMGILFAFAPGRAEAVTTGFNKWLLAIPDPFLQMFTVVMTGYVVSRSWEKVTTTKSKTNK